MPINTFIMIDFANSKNEGADWTGVTVVSIDQTFNWYVRLVKRYKLNPTEKIELLFTLWDQWKNQNLVSIGCEQKAYTDTIRSMFAEQINKRGTGPQIVELKDMGRRKEDRIRGALVARWEYGKILLKHPEEINDNTNDLIEEAVRFPKGKNDDLLDSLGYCDQLAFAPTGEKEEIIMTPEEEYFRQKISRNGKNNLGF